MCALRIGEHDETACLIDFHLRPGVVEEGSILAEEANIRMHICLDWKLAGLDRGDCVE